MPTGLRGARAKNDDGETPLDVAERKGHVEIAEMLRGHDGE